MTRLTLTKAPFLPLATTVYNKNQQDQFANALRLYFNQLDTLTGSLAGKYGGQYLDNPHGLFFSTVDQPGAVTATPVEFENTYLSNAVRVNAGTDTRIYVDIPGVYNFQFSAQAKSGNAATKQIYVWIVRDGIDIGYSTHQYTLAGSDTHLEISWNFNIDLKAGQYLEFEWAIDTGTVILESVVATSPHPGIPSAVVAVSYVAPLPDTLPTPP